MICFTRRGRPLCLPVFRWFLSYLGDRRADTGVCPYAWCVVSPSKAN